MSKEKAKRISSGHYLYRGFQIKRYPSQGLMPYRQWIWEAIDEHNGGFAHSHSLKTTKRLIDDEFEDRS